MITIPDQLHDVNFRFVKVKAKDKIPIEDQWTTKNNYAFSQVELSKWLMQGNNYGVACGFGGLLVVDSDTEELNKAIGKLPETFTVKTGNPDINHRHFYFICKDCDGKIVITKNNVHYGEIQSKGSQVIGPGSVHPNGRLYTILNNKPIAKIEFKELKDAVKNLVSTDRFEQKLTVSMPETKNKTIPKNIKELIKAGCSEGQRDFNTWLIVKTLANLGYDSDIIFEKAQEFNSKCLPPRDLIEVRDHVNQLLTHPEYLKETMTWDSVVSLMEEKILEAKPLTELENFIKSYSNRLDMIEQFYSRVPFSYDKNKIWWLWNNTRMCWEMTDETELLISIDRALDTSDNTIKSDVKNEILEAMRRVGRTHLPKPIKLSWVQFNNAIIDVATGETITPTPEYFSLNPIPWNLGESEDTPTIDKIFSEWVKPENVPTLFEVVSYCLLPDYPINRLFCFDGGGNNGKTCFNNLIINLVGRENIGSIDLDLLQTSRFESAKIYKKLVAFVGETNFSTIRKSDKLKKLCGKDVIDYEYKNKNGFSEYNYAKLIINTNALPLTNDRTRGFYRRWCIVDFPNEFTEAVDILTTIPEQEYKNLAKKCVRILTQLLKDREFTGEGSIEDREKRYEELSNPITKFIDLTYEKDIDEKVLFSEFRDNFLVWLKTNKLRVISSKELSLILAREGYSTKRIQGKEGETPKYYILGLSEKKANTDNTDNTDIPT